MASPQPDKFTKWSNELLEAIYRYPFTANELRVMLFIGRNTYGYGEKTIKLRVSEIAKGTNIGNKVINRVLKGLISSSCILYHQVEGKVGVTIGIQKDYDKWEARKKKSKSTIKLRVKHHQVEGKSKITPIILKEKRKINNKDPSKTNSLPKLSQLQIKYPWLDIVLWGEFRNMRTKIRKPMTSYAEKLRIGDLKKLIDKGYSQNEIVNKSISSSWQDFYEPKNDPGSETI